MIETNRGCPFSCAFCYWGRSGKIYIFSDERNREELKWICTNNLPFLWIIDSNWGLFKRDLDFSRYIVECKKLHNNPVFTAWHPAKNQPDRTLEIARMFKKVGIKFLIPLGIQSLTPEVLKNINRANVSFEEYAILQEKMHKEKLDSYAELIWGLPGETLSSFKKGTNILCELKADFMIYPFQLLNNTELNTRRDEFGIKTIQNQSDISEHNYVIQTKDIDTSDWEKGELYIRSLSILYTMQMLFCVGHYLNKYGKLSYSQLFTAFTDFCLINENRYIADYLNYVCDINDFRYIISHYQRENIENYIYGFVSSQKWWSDDDARAFYEIDLINRP